MKMALLIANRGFFPSEVIDAAREEMIQAMKGAGIEPICLNEGATRYGAVETTKEGMAFAKFLEDRRGEYDGLILCLPNFGDENGIKAAIRDVDVPVLLQAYPDEIGKMDFEHRRDAFCGKMALTSVLQQMKFKYTTFAPFVVHPLSAEFARQLRVFKSVCAIVKRLRKLRVGAIGARTTAFKSVRFDEMALEGLGIDVETLDLSSVFARMKKIEDNDKHVQDWLQKLYATSDFKDAPAGRDLVLAKFGATVAAIAGEMALDAIAVRCWAELQEQLGIAPCSILGVLNQSGLPAACELDVTNAISMLALSLASGESCGCLDWNNNYGDDPDKCILFHCGPLPLSLMQGPGVIEEHKMLSKSFGQGCSWGLNVGKMRLGELTFASMRTENGAFEYYVGKGEIVNEPVEEAFFGTPGVFEVPGLQEKLMKISNGGFRHHVTVTTGDQVHAIDEAFSKYLGYKKIEI